MEKKNLDCTMYFEILNSILKKAKQTNLKLGEKNI